MKNIAKKVRSNILKRENEKSAGGKTMRTFAVSDPRFSRCVSESMFEEREDEESDDDIEEANEKKIDTYSPSKNVKPLKKMKHGGKKKK